ncbi:MAG: hypothetical protein U0572_04285 [Phycisphaerales bacterium]
MAIRGITPILNVSNVPQSLAWFESLGWERSFAWNEGGMIAAAADRDAHGEAHFAGVCSGEFSIFLCRGGQGSRGTPARCLGDEDTGGVWMSWWVESPAELDRLHARALELGHAITWPPTDEPWGVREFRLQHPDGHMIRVSAGLSRTGA